MFNGTNMLIYTVRKYTLTLSFKNTSPHPKRIMLPYFLWTNFLSHFLAKHTMLKWSFLLLPLSSSLSTLQCKRIKARKTHQIGCDAIPNSNNTVISKKECLNHGCCWQMVADPKRRCFQGTKDEEHQWKDPSIHNSYLVIPTYIPKTTQMSPIQAEKLRSESKSNCLKSIEILTKLNNGKSCTKSVKIEERKSCEISHVLEQDPTISSCTACIMVGCCFDPSFNIE